MMKLGAAMMFAVGLAACGQKTGETAANEGASGNSEIAGANISASTIAPGNAANATSAAEQSGTPKGFGSLPPPNAPLRFVGIWASSQAECAAKPWRFTKTEVAASNGPHCSIYKISEVPGGYDLAVQCPTKKPVPTDLIKLRFAESARAMLVESNSIAPTGLVYCGK